MELGAELTSFIRADIKHFHSIESPAESQNLTAYPIFPNISARLVKNVVSVLRSCFSENIVLHFSTITSYNTIKLCKK